MTHLTHAYNTTEHSYILKFFFKKNHWSQINVNNGMDFDIPEVYLIGRLINNLLLSVVESAIPTKFITIYVNMVMKVEGKWIRK